MTKPDADSPDLVAGLGGIARADSADERTRAAAALAVRVVAHAEDGDAESLAVLLRANPRRPATVWRVHHFRLGDVTPSTNAAHDDPCAAVLALARPGDGRLVAGELLAVDADGSAWTALARVEDEIVVQVPSPRTLVGPAAAPDSVGPLLLAWREALGARPLATGSEGAAPPPPARPADRRTAVPRPPVGASDLAAALTALDTPGGPLDRLRASMEAVLGARFAALDADLAARFATVDARLAVAVEESTRLAVARALDDVYAELRQLREQLARIEKLLS